jgi:hypothetical protein
VTLVKKLLAWSQPPDQKVRHFLRVVATRETRQAAQLDKIAGIVTAQGRKSVAALILPESIHRDQEAPIDATAGREPIQA